MKLGVIVFFVILILGGCFDFANFQLNLGNLGYFFDLPSFVIVSVPTIVFAIGSYSWKPMVKHGLFHLVILKTVSSQNLMK